MVATIQMSERRAGPPRAVLVGCGAETSQDTRRELDGLGIRVEAEADDLRELPARLGSSGEGPWLFLMEARSPEDVRGLARLNEAFPGRPILALVGPEADPSMLLVTIRAGAAQVVRTPIGGDDFRAALERLAIQFGYDAGRSEVIVVSGVKAGAGATTVAINLAAQIAHEQGVTTLLTELPAQLGRLATYLNIEPALTIHDLLAEPARLDAQAVRQALTKVADGFQVLTGPYKSIAPRPFVADDMLRLIGLARRLAGALVIAVPDRFDDLYFEAMAAATRVVLVAEQKVSSLYALRMVHDTLDGRGIAAGRIVVLNRYDPKLRDFSVERVEVIAGRGNVATVANDYAAVVAAENHGCLLRVEAPRSKVIRDIGALASLLMARDPAGIGAIPARGRSRSARWNEAIRAWRFSARGVPRA